MNKTRFSTLYDIIRAILTCSGTSKLVYKCCIRHKFQVAAAPVWGLGKPFPWTQVMLQLPQWDYLDLCQLKHWLKSEQSGAGPVYLGTGWGISTSATSWPHLLLPPAHPQSSPQTSFPQPRAPPPTSSLPIYAPHPPLPETCTGQTFHDSWWCRKNGAHPCTSLLALKSAKKCFMPLLWCHWAGARDLYWPKVIFGLCPTLTIRCQKSCWMGFLCFLSCFCVKSSDPVFFILQKNISIRTSMNSVCCIYVCMLCA